MDAKMKSTLALPYELGHFERIRKHRRLPELWKIVLVLSLSALISLFLPAPWLFDSLRYTAVKIPSNLADNDPSTHWKDDIWPIRPPTPWDISTDYPFPRLLEYDVTEGTWLRLDVHPITGDIIFDIIGDIFCLPADSYLHGHHTSIPSTRAVPVLLGVPHDSDPHFSPEGDRIVFRSDAELGVENIWTTEWKGCSEMDVRPKSASGVLLDALQVKDDEEELLASGAKETAERRTRRLLREGRLNAQRVTNETYRWVSDARFHPSGSKIIATKWYTSSRSLGAGEGWEYPVPGSDSKDTTIEAGSGNRIVGRTLPFGWDQERYGDQQIGPEQFIWRGNDTLIYSKNVADSDGAFQYSKNVHNGVYAIFSTNITSKRTETIVNAFPGGATRPELSRDGRTLAFVRRVGDKEALVLKDLETGTIHHAWYGLTYDLGVISAPMGTYPSFAFTPADDAIIIWAAGQIYHVPLTTNSQGERVTSGTPTAIPFVAHIEKRIAETAKSRVDIHALETADTQTVHAFTELRSDETGSRVIFQGSGATYVYDVDNDGASEAKRIPVLDPTAPYYSPSFVFGADDLVIQARWSDVNFTTFEFANLTSGSAYELTGLSIGRYYSPVLCRCSGQQRKIAFVKTGGDTLTGNVVATAKPGLYLGEITLPASTQESGSQLRIENVRYIPSEIDTDDIIKTKLQFIERSYKLLVQSPRRAFVIDVAGGPDELGDYKHETLAEGRMSTELVVAPNDALKADKLAFIDFYHVYVTTHVDPADSVWSKPGNATKGLTRLSVDGGHDIIWSRDGKRLFWLLGPYLHWVDVSKLQVCASAVSKDQLSFGIDCTRHLPEFQRITVEYDTDIKRLKKEAKAVRLADRDPQAAETTDFFVIANATLLTMETGDVRGDLFHDAFVFLSGGEIVAILGVQDAVIPYGTTVLDAQGGFIIPGFIDVHAHWNGFDTAYPARSWELETFLAYGVTTLHNPSADNVLGFAERFRLERGQITGPRIFQVGGVIYGAGAPELHQDIVDMEEAYSALIRIKAEGGPASFSYKNYNLPSRASRQRLLTAARDLGMLCVPEGGMNQDWDLTYIIDGMTTVEHALPISVLYEDVLTLFALSGTGYTPTHIVNYGGTMGEQYVWANDDVPNDPKLRRLTRHDILELVTESTARPKTSYALFNTSESAAKMVRKGLRTFIGAHGEHPKGYNYHAEMYFTKEGGLTNYEVIRAATSDAAAALGIDNAVGSLVPGKLADFLIYPPGVDLLNGFIGSTLDIRYVVRGGRVWDAETMVEVWPVKGRRDPMPPFNPD